MLLFPSSIYKLSCGTFITFVWQLFPFIIALKLFYASHSETYIDTMIEFDGLVPSICYRVVSGI